MQPAIAASESQAASTAVSRILGDFNISKGFFERGIYCSNHNFNDSGLTAFASKNAVSPANLPHFGFLWDSSGPSNPVIFATQTRPSWTDWTPRSGAPTPCADPRGPRAQGHGRGRATGRGRRGPDV